MAGFWARFCLNRAQNQVILAAVQCPLAAATALPPICRPPPPPSRCCQFSSPSTRCYSVSGHCICWSFPCSQISKTDWAPWCSGRGHSSMPTHPGAGPPWATPIALSGTPAARVDGLPPLLPHPFSAAMTGRRTCLSMMASYHGHALSHSSSVDYLGGNDSVLLQKIIQRLAWLVFRWKIWWFGWGSAKNNINQTPSVPALVWRRQVQKRFKIIPIVTRLIVLYGMVLYRWTISVIVLSLAISPCQIFDKRPT